MVRGEKKLMLKLTWDVIERLIERVLRKSDLNIGFRHRSDGCSQGLSRSGYKPGEKSRMNFISCNQLLCYEFHGLVEASLSIILITSFFPKERSSS